MKSSEYFIFLKIKIGPFFYTSILFINHNPFLKEIENYFIIIIYTDI